MKSVELTAEVHAALRNSLSAYYRLHDFVSDQVEAEHPPKEVHFQQRQYRRLVQLLERANAANDRVNQLAPLMRSRQSRS